jgi:hypothetical protein
VITQNGTVYKRHDIFCNPAMLGIHPASYGSAWRTEADQSFTIKAVMRLKMSAG